MRLLLTGVLGVALSAGTAHAKIETQCESWNGGAEVRCTVKKLSGEAPETGSFYSQTWHHIAWNVSGYWSVCNLSGIIHWIRYRDNLAGLDNGFRFYAHGQVNKPNECFTIYYYNCHNELDQSLPCSTALSVVAVPP